MRPSVLNKRLRALCKSISEAGYDLLGLFVPRCCAACDIGLMRFEKGICLTCSDDLPHTRFHHDPANPVQKLFWGKVELHAASALLHFTSGGRVQRMLHRLKYHGDQDVGLDLGRRMGLALNACMRFQDVDLLIPVPLQRHKQRERGYNQSAVLIEGIRTVWDRPTLGEALVRTLATESQTRKGRMERWRNVNSAFTAALYEEVRGKHVLIVDDVVTTGATLESCAAALGRAGNVRISVFAAACA
jgi:ComF family protein